MGLSRILPSKFLGFLPLYVGVELTLLYGIINKMCGPYGLLSLLTGHPINFMQWFYFLTSTVVLVFFLVGFRSVHHPNINTFSLVAMIYFIDTFAGCIFTAYFVWFWFKNETNASEGSSDTSSSDKTNDEEVAAEVVLLVKRVSEDLSSQSASESYELFMTVILTLLTTVFRFYFLLIMLSFFKQMVRQSKYNSRFRLSTAPTSTGKFAALLNRVEVYCYNFLNRLVR